MSLRITRNFCFSIFSLISFSNAVFAQENNLNAQIADISREVDGIVGAGVMNLKSKEFLIWNEDHKFPMQSVFKFPLAMAVLDLVDKRELRLEQKIHLTKKDYFANTYSPMRDKYPEAEVDVTLAELLTYTVSLSDNIACDILFRLVGGVKPVDNYIHSLGVTDIAIVANEEQMHSGWEVQYTNWCRPKAMLELLDIFYQGKKLSKPSSDFLWKIMTDGPTGPKRIKGLIGPDTVVAHKTGTSGSNSQGLMGGVNDVGIVKLKKGQDFAIVVYVSDTHSKTEVSEQVIAKIAKAAADYFSNK
ncbi:MAG: class A beta-lactamase, subclass A2 [Dyadobacter sp.]|uniref:class A beta-lactamase, subclass A2 n=1 Tax=Dyadobacter sp. TaxID=1914288 RepID=UPI00326699BF